MSRRTRTGVIWLAVLLMLGATACEEDSAVIVRIQAADFNPVLELTRLEITIAASRTDQGDRICTPYTHSFNLDPARTNYWELPLSIRVTPGPTYDRILFVQVRGYLEGMLRLKVERMVSLQGGEVELDIDLLRDCLGVATGRTESCVNGTEVTSPYWEIFEGTLNVENEPCVD